MHLTSFILPVLTLVGAASAKLNTTREFRLVTQIKPGQRNKQRFAKLELSAYHSGAGTVTGSALHDIIADHFAGENDGVLLKGEGIAGFFNKTNPVIKRPNGQPYYNLEFDLGNDFPYAPQLEGPNSYVQWVPVAINVGDSSANGAYFFNKTGLQYTTAPGQKESIDGFGGWLVCNWWRGVPQLFMRLQYYNETRPANCADVYLMPKYI